jgi:hypothetical protein
VRAWAVFSAAGDPVRGVGLSGQNVSTGNYHVIVSPTNCQPSTIDPTVTPDTFAVNGAYPVAWAFVNGSTNQINVTTGLASGGTFTPANEAFNVQVACS